MHPPQSSRPALPAEWAATLDAVENVLADAVRAVEARESALSDPDPGGAARTEKLLADLAGLTGRARGLTDPTGAAGRAVAEIDAALASGEDALAAWFRALEALRGKLAGRGGLV